jgi:hypothetical protein
MAVARTGGGPSRTPVALAIKNAFPTSRTARWEAILVLVRVIQFDLVGVKGEVPA